MAIRSINTSAAAGVLALLAILFTALVLCSCGRRSGGATQSAAKNVETVAAPDSMTIALTGEDSVNVLDLLKRHHKVDCFSTALGTFVRSIDSIGNSSTVYWVYSVNDSTPQVASDKIQTRTGDRVVWHLRKVRK